MGSIDVLATIFAGIIILKFAFMLILPQKFMMKLITKLYKNWIFKNRSFVFILQLVLVAVIGCYVFKNITVQTIAAVALLVTFAMSAFLMSTPEGAYDLTIKMLKGDKGKIYFWFVLWVVFALVVLYQIYF